VRFSKPFFPALSILLTLLFWGFAADAAPPIPAPPQVAASGYLLIDMDSHKVLAEKNSDQRLEPASLTKIMTAYVVFRELANGKIKLSDPVQISEKAWREPGSRMFVEVGKQVSVEELLKGMIIQSGNDASVALAEHIAGTEATFAELMNTHARRLGMTDTHFVNSTGLPAPEHYTTPRDITKVTEATIREFPQFYEWYSVHDYTFNDIKQHNRNRLLWRDESVDGVKTGHTEAAGYCLVASAERNGDRLISVVMGTSGEEARARESQALLNYGFRFYETHLLYPSDEALKTLRVWKGDQEEIALAPARDVYVTIPRGQYDQLSADLILDPQVVAPLERGMALGRVDVRLGEEPVAQVPLVAQNDVAEGGFWHNTMDSMLLWLE
jgi:D-alanyl-D-alanine carboxypeptidase (penicillin-binding protein 5/6)